MSNQLTISIDRQSKSWAVFKSQIFPVKDFTAYESEEGALKEAKAWVSERSSEEPEIVYPNVTRMTVSYGRRKRR